MSLRATQELFFRAIRWPTGVADFLNQADPETRAAFARVFVGTEAFSRMERVDVYANAYFYRLLSALSEMFPRLAYLAGDADFHNLVTDYVLECPSAAPDLRRLGDRLPGFVATHSLSRRWPVLVAVTELELALSAALDRGESGGVTEAALADVPPQHWPELRFELSAPTCRVDSDRDLEQLSRLCDDKQREAALALPSVPAHSVLVGRRGHAVYFRTLHAAEAAALAGFQRGLTFGAVCDSVTAAHPGFGAAEMVAVLQRWVADGVLGAVIRQGV